MPNSFFHKMKIEKENIVSYSGSRKRKRKFEPRIIYDSVEFEANNGSKVGREIILEIINKQIVQNQTIKIFGGN